MKLVGFIQVNQYEEENERIMRGKEEGKEQKRRRKGEHFLMFPLPVRARAEGGDQDPSGSCQVKRRGNKAIKRGLFVGVRGQI